MFAAPTLLRGGGVSWGEEEGPSSHAARKPNPRKGIPLSSVMASQLCNGAPDSAFLVGPFSCAPEIRKSFGVRIGQVVRVICLYLCLVLQRSNSVASVVLLVGGYF